MRAVIQRVLQARVVVSDEVVGDIQSGIVILLGVGVDDGADDIEWLVRKVINMRIYSDDNGKMNECIMDQAGEFLVVSQFTLHASTKKGNRPSFIRAARPDAAELMYMQFCRLLGSESGLKVERGVFGADMKVSLVNDGPVTIILDSKDRY